MLRISSSHADYLLKQPESGMGYQTIEATTFADKTRRGVAFNAELIVFDDEERTPLRTKTFRTLTEAARSSDLEIRTLRVLARPSMRTLERREAGAKTELDPISWTLSEGRIRCPEWDQARVGDERADSSRRSLGPGPSGWSWMRARRSARSPASWI